MVVLDPLGQKVEALAPLVTPARPARKVIRG